MPQCDHCCQNCMFWKSGMTEEYTFNVTTDTLRVSGECHRLPPSLNGHMTVFPKVLNSSWCGEWKQMSPNMASPFFAHNRKAMETILAARKERGACE